MKVFFLLFLLFAMLKAQTVTIENLRTELYSKEAKNSLKKVELSLEFDGENLSNQVSKLNDATNTVISSFFYEDIFTELGKLRFKQSLSKYINKKYKIDIKDIYIIKLKGVQKFDIEELKSFLKDYDNENELKDDKKEVDDKKEYISKENNITVPDIDKITDVGALLNDNNSNDLNVDTIDPSILEIPTLPKDITPNLIQLKDKNISLKDINASR
nr:flagellar basal body-associated FliL family protein [uncultured Campylobacter sp.]